MSNDFIRQFKPNVLLVEDDEITQKIEAFTFQTLGCEVDSVTNAMSALNALEKSYDLIVLDIGLPDQSGVDLAKDIRRGKTKQKHDIPIIAVSSYAAESDRSRYKTAGIDAVFPKPLNPESMKKLLLRIVEKKNLHSPGL